MQKGSFSSQLLTLKSNLSYFLAIQINLLLISVYILLKICLVNTVLKTNYKHADNSKKFVKLIN